MTQKEAIYKAIDTLMDSEDLFTKILSSLATKTEPTKENSEKVKQPEDISNGPVTQVDFSDLDNIYKALNKRIQELTSEVSDIKTQVNNIEKYIKGTSNTKSRTTSEFGNKLAEDIYEALSKAFKIYL